MINVNHDIICFIHLMNRAILVENQGFITHTLFDRIRNIIQIIKNSANINK